MATITALATSVSGNTFTGTINNPEYAYTNVSSTDRAQYSLATGTAGNSAELYLTGYDFSAIPQNATIDSVMVRVKAMINSATYVTSSSAQAYVGTSAKGSSQSLQTTMATTYTIFNGSLTRSELDNLRIRFFAQRSSQNGNRNRLAAIYIYGTEIVVNYTLADGSTVLQYKVNGNWRTVSKVFKKVDNIWVEQTNLESLFDTNTNYLNGD